MLFHDGHGVAFICILAVQHDGTQGDVWVVTQKDPKQLFGCVTRRAPRHAEVENRPLSTRQVRFQTGLFPAGDHLHIQAFGIGPNVGEAFGLWVTVSDGFDGLDGVSKLGNRSSQQIFFQGPAECCTRLSGRSGCGCTLHEGQLFERSDYFLLATHADHSINDHTGHAGFHIRADKGDEERNHAQSLTGFGFGRSTLGV